MTDLNTKHTIIFALTTFGYMIIGTVLYQTVDAIRIGALHYLFFIPIFFVVSLSSFVFGNAVGTIIKEIRHETKRQGR